MNKSNFIVSFKKEKKDPFYVIEQEELSQKT